MLNSHLNFTKMKLYFFYIIFPMIISNVLHMLVVKKNIWEGLTIPICASCFGKNKTWRGFILLPLLNGIVLFLLCLIYPVFSIGTGFLVGIILGLAYLICELPNSYLKRRLGISSGEKAKKNAWIFHLLDKTDSSLGVSLVSYFLLHLNIVEAIQLFFVAIFTHIFFSGLLVFIKIKKRF